MPELLAAVATRQAGAAFAPVVWRLKHRDGSWRYAEVVADNLLAEPDVAGMVLTARDVTERQREAVALEEARDAALDASRAKSAFLANMSHEVRTPMNAILRMADVLAGTPLTAEQQEYVGIFRGAGDALLALIDDILDLSKVEAGQLELEATDFDPAELAEGTAQVMAVRAHSKWLELTCEVAPDVPSRVRGDAQRLRQVLLNLLSNAVKFTDQGEVALRVERAGEATAAPGALRFSVRDTGIGIAPDRLATVFGAFTQVDASTTRRYGGTGLGLAIVERLVQRMGGQVSVESVAGEGSTLAFTVPLDVPAGVDVATAQPLEPVIDLRRTRLLVVDDNATNRLILRRILTQHGAIVVEADSGASGLTALRAARAAGTPYDLLLDQRMPDMDGFQLVGRVREEAGGAPGDAVDGATTARPHPLCPCRPRADRARGASGRAAGPPGGSPPGAASAAGGRLR